MKRFLLLLLVLVLIAFPCLAEFDLSSMTESELQDLINQASAQLEILRSAQSENPEALEFTGTGTKILTNVNVSFGPCRVTFEQEKSGEFKVSYVLGNSSRNLMYGFGGTKQITSLTRSGVFEFDIEASSSWRLLIEPLIKSSEAINLEGTGDYVSDIFVISTSTILCLNAQYNDFNNFIITAYTSTDGSSWSSDGLTNGLKSAGGTDSFEKIIRVTKPTYIFFDVDFDNGDWSIKPQT